MNHQSLSVPQFERAIRSPRQKALDDLYGGLQAYHVWGLLGWQDIRQRYRRSLLGPFWLTISTGIMVSAIGFLYSKIFGQPVEEYVPYLAVGVVVWNFLSATINESCTAFVGSEQIIKQVKLPLTVHVVRTVFRNLIIIAHNSLILVLVQLVFQKGSVLAWAYVVPAIFLVAVNTLWIGMLLAIFCARFRDIPLIIVNIVQIAFFLTPIIWGIEQLGDRVWFAYVNPFFHLIEIVRAPLLQSTVPMLSLLAALGMVVMGFPLTLLVMKKFRTRVPYWL